MLDRARASEYAISAVNVTSSQTFSAALQGFTEAESDGIIQVLNGGVAYWFNSSRADRVKGSLATFAYAYSIVDLYPITFALYMDHCPRKPVDIRLRPLFEIKIGQAKRDEPAAFQSHMWDDSVETLDDNVKSVVGLPVMSKKANTILRIEIGVVGGEESGIKGEENANLYIMADDAWAAAEALGLGKNGRCTTALIFGNMRGAYKPGHVKFRPELLSKIRVNVVKRLGDCLVTEVGDKKTPLDLAMHGGSGFIAEKITTAVHSDVTKVNVDTDIQYAFTCPVADRMFKSCDGVFKIDDEVDSKKTYDPRVWDKAAKKGMVARAVKACERLSSVGSTCK